MGARRDHSGATRIRARHRLTVERCNRPDFGGLVVGRFGRRNVGAQAHGRPLPDPFHMVNEIATSFIDTVVKHVAANCQCGTGAGEVDVAARSEVDVA